MHISYPLRTTLLIGLLACAGPAVATTTITFDDLGLAPNQSLQVELLPVAVGQGFTMTRSSVDSGTQGVVINAVGLGNNVNNGGNSTFSYLAGKGAGQALSHTLMRPDGLSFDLQSLRYHGWNNNFAAALIVTGNLAAGGTISASFSITNINTNPYHLATFSPAWSGLSSVAFTSANASIGVFQLDDIVTNVSAVPEPATAASMGAGLALLLARVLKRHQSPLQRKAA